MGHMSDERYDAKEAYNKNLSPKSRMHYLENNSEWESWVPADVAAKVKSSL